MLNLKHENFVAHVRSDNSIALPSFSPRELDINPSRRLQMSSLIAEETFTKVFTKYSDFANVFSPDLLFKLYKHIEINDHAIKLVNG